MINNIIKGRSNFHRWSLCIEGIYLNETAIAAVVGARTFLALKDRSIGLLQKQRLYNDGCAFLRHFRSGHFQIKTMERSFNN